MARKLNYAKAVTNTNQRTKARKDQVKNYAGGYVFQIDEWQTLRRFLILGTEGGTYYTKEHPLTVKSAQNVLECINTDFDRTVKEIVDVSDQGLAHKNDPALFALALCVANQPKGQTVSPDAINKVVRTGTHFLTFIGYLDELASWNRKVRRLMWTWYQKPLDKLAYQMVKYQSRGDWSQRDALRVIHRKPRDEQESLLFKWVTDRDSFYEGKGETKKAKPIGILLLDAYMEAHREDTTEKRLVQIIRDHGLTHEMLPTKFKKSKKVWEALTEKMPMTAMIRNLGVMSSVGLLTSSNLDLVTKIENSLENVEALQKARVHPMTILFALKTYAEGQGFRGSLNWKPVQRVVDALDGAFYLAFKAVEPTGKRFMFGVDVSGSMSWTMANSNVTCCEAAGAMALVTANTEKNYAVYGFADRFVELKISPKMRLDQVARVMQKNNFGRTDCALPMIHAQKMGAKFDVFIVITDNETWYGKVHPFQALRNYRKAVNPDAKLVVMGMTATEFSIADPTDSGTLDVVGMDANVPRIIRSFVVGEV